MFSTVGKSLLFVASFSPAWAIAIIDYAIHNFEDPNSWTVILAASGVMAYAVLATAGKFRSLRRSANAKKAEIVQVRMVTVEYLPYLLTSMVPVLVGFGDLADALTAVAITTILAIIYVRTGMVLTNPALILAGFLRSGFTRRAPRITPDRSCLISKQYPQAELSGSATWLTTSALNRRSVLSVKPINGICRPCCRPRLSALPAVWTACSAPCIRLRA